MSKEKAISKNCQLASSNCKIQL